jgi:uncharacterized protein
VEYRLKFLRELKDYQRIFLFTTPPEHKGRGERGSAELAELIKSHNPRLVLVGGREPAQELIGNSLVIALGSLMRGEFTLVDVRKAASSARHCASIRAGGMSWGAA